MILYTVINFSIYVFYVLFYLSFFVLVKQLPDKVINKKMLFYGLIALVCHLAANLLPRYISESFLQYYYVRYLILFMLLDWSYAL